MTPAKEISNHPDTRCAVIAVRDGQPGLGLEWRAAKEQEWRLR